MTPTPVSSRSVKRTVSRSVEGKIKRKVLALHQLTHSKLKVRERDGVEYSESFHKGTGIPVPFI